MSNIKDALAKHGNAVDAILNEGWELWPLGESMQLLAYMAREIAAAEKIRRANGQSAPPK